MLTAVSLFMTLQVSAQGIDDHGSAIVAPLRVRDLTLPNALVMGLIPVPPQTVGRKKWAFEFSYSHANSFQMSGNVENYLAGRNDQGPLTESDVRSMLAENDQDMFYIDVELGLAQLSVHYGFSEHLDFFLNQPYFVFSGGSMDSVIEGFHDALGLSQAGRDMVARDQFQIMLRHDGGGISLLDRPTTGGFGDPTLGIRYAHPTTIGGWKMGFEAGIKLPLADDGSFLSSGNPDLGMQLAFARSWGKRTLVVNASYVFTGNFETAPDFEPSNLPAVNLSYLRRLGPNSTLIAQMLTAGSIFSDVTDSAISDLEFQMTLGIKWRLKQGTASVALTENLFNYDNTPDIAVHLGYGVVLPGPPD